MSRLLGFCGVFFNIKIAFQTYRGRILTWRTFQYGGRILPRITFKTEDVFFTAEIIMRQITKQKEHAFLTHRSHRLVLSEVEVNIEQYKS